MQLTGSRGPIQLTASPGMSDEEERRENLMEDLDQAAAAPPSPQKLLKSPPKVSHATRGALPYKPLPP